MWSLAEDFNQKIPILLDIQYVKIEKEDLEKDVKIYNFIKKKINSLSIFNFYFIAFLMIFKPWIKSINIKLINIKNNLFLLI